MKKLSELIVSVRNWLTPRQQVTEHRRNQAYGERWSRHRPRWIDGYSRRHGRRRW